MPVRRDHTHTRSARRDKGMIWHEKGRNCRGKGRNCRTPWPVPSRDSAPIAPQGRAAAAAAAVARPATLPRLLVAIMTCVGAPDLLSGGA